MPGYRGHLAGGFGTFLLLAYAVTRFRTVGIFRLVEWCICALLGSLFPDVDTKSKGQKIFYTGLFLYLLYLLYARQYQQIAFVSVCAITPLLVHHRGIFHNPIFIVLLSVGLYYVLKETVPMHKSYLVYDAVFFCVGALSHIFLDRSISKIKRL